MSFHVPEKFRLSEGRLKSDASYGNNGAFFVRLKHNQVVFVIAGDGLGWEHVSVSRKDRCPTWEEMFWDESDCVVQYHPPKESYVNNHPYCLHLWRPISEEIPMPPSCMVGI